MRARRPPMQGRRGVAMSDSGWFSARISKQQLLDGAHLPFSYVVFRKTIIFLAHPCGWFRCISDLQLLGFGLTVRGTLAHVGSCAVTTAAKTQAAPRRPHPVFLCAPGSTPAPGDHGCFPPLSLACSRASRERRPVLQPVSGFFHFAGRM